MIYYWDKKTPKKIAYPPSWYDNNCFVLMSQPQRKPFFLLDVFQMTDIALVSVKNHYHINRLHLFWDTLFFIKYKPLLDWPYSHLRRRLRSKICCCSRPSLTSDPWPYKTHGNFLGDFLGKNASSKPSSTEVHLQSQGIRC